MLSGSTHGRRVHHSGRAAYSWGLSATYTVGTMWGASRRRCLAGQPKTNISRRRSLCRCVDVGFKKVALLLGMYGRNSTQDVSEEHSSTDDEACCMLVEPMQNSHCHFDSFSCANCRNVRGARPVICCTASEGSLPKPCETLLSNTVMYSAISSVKPDAKSFSLKEVGCNMTCSIFVPSTSLKMSATYGRGVSDQYLHPPRVQGHREDKLTSV